MKRTEHNEKTWKFPFVSYIPESFESKLPLIVQLHGSGEWGRGGEELHLVEVHGFTEIVRGKDYPCLLVMPQCPTDTFWTARIESVLEFIQQLKDAYPIDEDRVCLTGLSMGGYCTWFTAIARPDLFSCIAPVCGGGIVWRAEVLKMPIWAWHGAEDDIVSVSQSDEMVEAVRKTNPNVRYSRLPGVGHASWDHAYQEELMEWILAQKRDGSK